MAGSNQKSVTRNGWVIVVILAAAVFVLGMDRFWSGFHNADMCQNLDSLSIETGMTIYEQEIFSEHLVTLDSCYLSGLRMILKGYYGSIVAAMLFGLGVRSLW